MATARTENFHDLVPDRTLLDDFVSLFRDRSRAACAKSSSATTSRQKRRSRSAATAENGQATRAIVHNRPARDECGRYYRVDHFDPQARHPLGLDRLRDRRRYRATRLPFPSRRPAKIVVPPFSVARCRAAFPLTRDSHEVADATTRHWRVYRAFHFRTRQKSASSLRRSGRIKDDRGSKRKERRLKRHRTSDYSQCRRLHRSESTRRHGSARKDSFIRDRRDPRQSSGG